MRIQRNLFRFLSYPVLALLLFTPLRFYAQVVINEYSASNINTITDPYGDYSDWVELYNPSPTPVVLGGMYLSDNPGNLQKWEIPAGFTINAGGRIMIFCNGEDAQVGTILCPDFKLTQTHGEWFILSDATGFIIDSVNLQLTRMNHSRGRTTDGASTWAVFSTPTPNAPNTGGFTAYMANVVMDIPPGFYTTAQTVSLSCSDPSAEIRYTTNGSDPVATSPLYTAPININATTVLRAAAFPTNPNYLRGFDETNTYFINESVSPTMNVISVSGPFTTLFSGWPGSNGIYNCLEFFDKNRDFQFELQGQSRPHGNDSWANDQKGFRFYARDELGYKNEMPYKFFSNSLRDSFKVIILKGGASDNFPNGPANSCHIRDPFVQTLAQKYGLEMDSRKYEPTVLYVNGQYWGIYEIRERVDNDYTEYYYNKSKKKVDILKYWGGLNIEDGSDTGWVNLYNFIMANNMATASNYEYVSSVLNIKSFIQYFIFNTYLVNTDWLNWNTMWWRGRNNPTVKWRYVLWDCDNVLDLGQNYTNMPGTDFNTTPCAPFDLFQNNSNIKHTDMLVQLMENEEFQTQYTNEFLDMLNGPFNCDNMISHLDSLLGLIQPEMPMHIARWGGNYNTWLNNVEYLKTQILGRCGVIAEALDSCMDIYPQRLTVLVSPAGTGTVSMNSNLLSPYPWSQVILADSNYLFKATPAQPYWTFDHWEYGNNLNGISIAPTDSQIYFNFKTEDTLVAVFKYFNPDSVAVTFDVRPSDAFGTISLNNNVLPVYPYTTTLDRRNTYDLTAHPKPNWISGATNEFLHWGKQQPDSTQFFPDSLAHTISFTYRIGDTIIAYFDSISPPPPPPPDSFLIIPNAFSPNGDGLNDVFEIKYGKDLTSLEMKIFNRWGELIWSNATNMDMWDGTQNGNPCEISTYFYMLKAVFGNGNYEDTRTRTGEIILIR